MKFVDIGLTQIGFWKNGNLNYNVFVVLCIFLGMLGIDHLYLRSPWTFLLKLILNAYTFGFVWFYDILQALFNSHELKTFGVGLPFIGNLGIGAGMFLGIPENMDKTIKGKSYNFLIYFLVLLFTGFFGGDSFLTGKTRDGIIRLLCVISFIGIPIAGIWAFYNVFKFFFKTGDVIKDNGEYFGIEGSSSIDGVLDGIFEYLKQIPLVGSILALKDTLFGTAKIAIGVGKGIVNVATKGIVGGGDIPKIENTISLETPIYCGCLISILFIVLAGYLMMFRKKKIDDINSTKDDTPPPLIGKH